MIIDFFVKFTKGIGGKIIFGAILFSMIFVWGAGGLTSLSMNPEEAAKIGSKKLSVNRLNNLFMQEIQSLSNLMGGEYISPTKAMEMGLLAQALQKEIDRMIFDNVKEDLGLTASNAAVRNYLENNPAFADSTGNFDRNLFMAYLRQINMSELQLAKQLQNELAKQHLIRALTDIAYSPDQLFQIVHKYQNEKRDIIALDLKTDKMKLSQKPTETELKEYYDIYGEEQFMTPEYRQFKYIRLNPDVLSKQVNVSKEEIDSLFEIQKDNYTVPEKRQVSQMYFRDEESARDMMNNLTADNFIEQATNVLGQTEEETDFGLVTKNELMEELAEPVFQATKNQIVGPIESITGWHILLVRDIQSEQKTPEKEIRQQIKKQIANEKSYTALEETVRQLEDILGVGDNLEKASKELKLSLQDAPAMDITGYQQDGNKVESIINHPELLKQLFTLREGEISPIFEVEDGFIAVELTNIQPVSMKPFEDVRSELVNIWTQNKKAEKLKELSDSILERVQSGTSLQTIGTFENIKIIREKNLTRNGNEEITKMMADTLFKQPKGIDGLSTLPTAEGVIIALTNQIHYPDNNNEEELNKTKTLVQEIIATELGNNFISSYADEIGISINQSTIDKAFSAYKTME